MIPVGFAGLVPAIRRDSVGVSNRVGLKTDFFHLPNRLHSHSGPGFAAPALLAGAAQGVGERSTT